ncbi:MAG: hypothetical protein GXY20_02155 [Clostridiales bacterium]|nr:hypothetical protein [Clostridiales bacterium]
MKQICHNCGAEVSYRLGDKIKKVECKSCNRLLFDPVKKFTYIYLVISFLIAAAVWYFVDKKFQVIPFVWAVYVPVLIAIAVMFVLTMLHPIFISMYYRSRQKKR